MAAEDFVRTHIESFNAHDANTWASHYAEGAVFSDPQYPQQMQGRDAIRKDIQDFFDAFPDMQFKVASVVASGDHAAIEGTGSGTHKGSMEGPAGTIPATNKRVDIPFAVFVKFDSSGLIAEERRYYDLAGMMGQLGLMDK